MTLLTFTAYALDGFAYAVEAHSGQAYGARDGSQLLDVWRAACRQSGIVALLFSVVYLLAGEHIIALLTSLTQIQQLADRYLIWQVILPLVGVWCYLLDGMFYRRKRVPPKCVTVWRWPPQVLRWRSLRCRGWGIMVCGWH
ncbi:DNA-damage-inducible SOS response protein [Escherichia coli]|nr:DNA-damage-inducible SOS response protein [Escherichia coli]